MNEIPLLTIQSRGENPKAEKTLYKLLLGPAHARLSPGVKNAFCQGGRRYGKGIITIKRGGSLVSRLFGWFENLPKSGEGISTELLVTPHNESETWRRRFGSRIVVTEQSIKEGLLTERLGSLEFVFELAVRSGALVYIQKKVVLDIFFMRFTMPRLIAPWVEAFLAEDKEEVGRVIIKVRASTPLTGLIMGYEGTIDMRTA